ncbi:uncharacterized protein LOC122008934 [Zingiber officinale]|uniref:uncharacterized protein LOC122008934 n=1 Tax=Zingiber officinale TaxID=94328 RepID=UPI001C4ABD34|nr:uncharacterized protein LOC122008934 [Zingiber officinale]
MTQYIFRPQKRAVAKDAHESVAFNSEDGQDETTRLYLKLYIKAGLPCMNLLRMTTVPILEQLYLEERLLRSSTENWCIINHGTSLPTIVMGISGRPSELVELKSVLRYQIPVIRRFSGGGTVIIDNVTLFVSLICNKNAISGCKIVLCCYQN